jgi:hypothetical protein
MKTGELKMVTRASATWDGEEPTTHELPSTKNHSSSDDYQSQGVEVQRGFFKSTVHSADELNDDDMVEVDGISIKASMAKELGLMGEVFKPVRSPNQLDPNLSAGAAAQQQEQQQESEGTGYVEYDTAAKGLNDAIEAGHMEFEEAQSYDTILAQTAMAGMSVNDAVQTLSDLASGTKSQMDIGSENATMLKDAETKVTSAATKSAKTELGREGFDVIQRAASVSPEVNAALRSYAVMRATGKADGVTWSDFLGDVQAHLNG